MSNFLGRIPPCNRTRPRPVPRRGRRGCRAQVRGTAAQWNRRQCERSESAQEAREDWIRVREYIRDAMTDPNTNLQIIANNQFGIVNVALF